ncbi:hypothetical protein H1P_360031 [Hyella patelloides LEGE 07179]|uniref:Uncharacterized protein n=1 Tax=Hyella patelloides LEGE 07179 TaxID=945734 RepID=A0A563VWA4_9CYAN|nr:hypothetical protein H1P_360031 [Hyella patelloides LEGE 07179]
MPDTNFNTNIVGWNKIDWRKVERAASGFNVRTIFRWLKKQKFSKS